MRLIDLEPRWLNANVLAFRCPHCRKDWLTCKNVVMSQREQWELFEKSFGEDWNTLVVPCRDEFCWTITGDFSNMTVSPSIDASNSGHWHGSIINGLTV